METRGEAPYAEDAVNVHDLLVQSTMEMLAGVKEEEADEEDEFLPRPSFSSKACSDLDTFVDSADLSLLEAEAGTSQMLPDLKKEAARLRRMINYRRRRANEDPSKAVKRRVSSQERWQKVKNDPEKLAEWNRKRSERGKLNRREETEEQKELRRQREREKYERKKREREEMENGKDSAERQPNKCAKKTNQELTIAEAEAFAKERFAKQLAFQRRKMVRMASKAHGVGEKGKREREVRVGRTEKSKEEETTVVEEIKRVVARIKKSKNKESTLVKESEEVDGGNNPLLLRILEETYKAERRVGGR